ncbi:hypothetical protein VNO77_29029 [Canavalia gladiata]|uniref:Uncharacterized protein n=1 Tax=Canavalia gladiata TaxID=3824 RepID=A0AAN9KZW3_CANGL
MPLESIINGKVFISKPYFVPIVRVLNGKYFIAALARGHHTPTVLACSSEAGSLWQQELLRARSLAAREETTM